MMMNKLWLWCVWCLVAGGAAWGAEYQVIDLGPEWRPLAISAAGDIAGYKDLGGAHEGRVRLADGRELVLPSPNPGDNVVHVTGISSQSMVGWVSDGTCYMDCARGVRWTAAGAVEFLPTLTLPPPANRRPFVVPWAVNDSGHIAGEGLYDLPLAWIEGQPRFWGGAGAAKAINNQGVVVGVSDGHATRWTAEGATRLDTPNTPSSIALAISDNGTITGSGEAKNGERQAFVWREGSGMQLLPLLPGDLESEGMGMRADGVVFGNSWNDFAARAVRWYPRNGQIVMEDLQTLIDAPGWELESLVAVNASGTAVGFGQLNGVTHAFLLQPITPLAGAAERGNSIWDVR
jgi:probable HAF family extracellular repeat protein